MILILGYTDKRGAGITMTINPAEVENKLINLAKRHILATIWDQNNRSNELGGTFKHLEVGWTWYYDSDILK